MIQLQAGYILDCVKETLETNYTQNEVKGLLTQLSYFDIEVNSNSATIINNDFEQIFSVANNIISRGLPTRTSLWLEERILQEFDLTEQDKKLLEIGTIKYKFNTDVLFTQKLYRALHIIDPELKGDIISRENLGSSYEDNFLYKQLPYYASQMWVQLFESQRELENVLRFSTSIDEKVEEIFNPIRSYKKSECVLENYNEFPSKLGLPIWLGNLLSTINHYNSKEIYNHNERYEVNFYPAFLKSCKVGVDYSLMFHEWELMLLTEMIPKQEREKKNIIDLIELHRKALSGEKIERKLWIELQKEIEVLMKTIVESIVVSKEVELKELEILNDLEYSRNNNKIEYRKLHDEYYSFERYKKSFGQLIWNTGRVAYLSIENFLNHEYSLHISSEALVNALVEEYINNNKEFNKNAEDEFRKRVWHELMDRLQVMLINWV